METTSIKGNLYKQCLAFLDDRLRTVQNTMSEIQESLLSETKSSAGDKHETGRAMLQLEREKAGNQLAEVQKTGELLSKVNVSKTGTIVGLGSIVYTSKSNYYIAISAGLITHEKDSFYAISANTPIGRLLVSKTVGDVVRFRDQEFVIKKVI